MLLRRGFEGGRRAYGPIDLSYEAYVAHVVEAASRRLTAVSVPVESDSVRRTLALMALEDLFLAAACARRVPGAWEAFVAEYVPRMKAYLLSKGAASSAAQEVAEEVPGEAFAPPSSGEHPSRLSGFDGTSSLFGWLRVLAHRRFVDRIRRAAKAGPLPETDGPEEPQAPPADPPASGLIAAETALALRAAFEAAWKRFSDRDILALRMDLSGKCRRKDIARVLGVGRPRVTRILDRVLKVIQEEFARRRGGPDASTDESKAVWEALLAEIRRRLATPDPPLDPPEMEPST